MTVRPDTDGMSSLWGLLPGPDGQVVDTQDWTSPTRTRLTSAPNGLPEATGGRRDTADRCSNPRAPGQQPPDHYPPNRWTDDDRWADDCWTDDDVTVLMVLLTATPGVSSSENTEPGNRALVPGRLPPNDGSPPL